MSLFDALTLSFGTAGTGGFGILNSGASTYSSYVQVVITVFMFIFGIDFSFYYLILMRRIKSAFKMEEVRAYVLIIVAATLLIVFDYLSNLISVNLFYISVNINPHFHLKFECLNQNKDEKQLNHK
jgi:trk system potassium uptake protein TrkH